MNSELAYTRLQPTGERLLTPPLGEVGARIVLEGVFTFHYTGARFDALYMTGPDGLFARRHPYLQWSPREPLLESEDLNRHRYQFRVPAGWNLEGQSLGLRVDVDRFVDEFLIPPSEVRGALTGEMTLRVLPPPATPGSLWAMMAAASLPAAAVAGGVGWVLWRRMALQGLPPELQEQLVRINRKHRIAHAALGPSRSPRLQETLGAVHAGAWSLARQIRALHTARSQIDGLSLQSEAERLEQELDRFADPIARAEGKAALAEKRKTLEILDEMELLQKRSTLRLATIEATLDTTCLSLRRPPPGSGAPFEDPVLCELEAEVTAIAEVEQEIRSLV
jgi:hypothetical protein